MSKSTLSITVWSGRYQNEPRTFEVPCRLPEAFNFKFAGKTFTADIADSDVIAVDADSSVHGDDFDRALIAADSVLATIKAALGITGPVPPGSPLPAIALAYEAECAAYDACMNAHGELPPLLHGDAMYWPDPGSGVGHACRMLQKYVEYVFEQACKSQTERAESKVTP